MLSPDLSEYWRDFAREFDVEFDDRGNRVIDHFTYDTELDDGTHSALVLPLAGAPAPFITLATQAGPPLLYRGVGHEVGRQPLLSNILHARATAYSFDSKPDELLTEDAFIAGSAVGLVSAMQARNNARVTFVGSLDLFSDAFADASVSSADGLTCVLVLGRYAELEANHSLCGTQVHNLGQQGLHQGPHQLDLPGVGRPPRLGCRPLARH